MLFVAAEPLIDPNSYSAFQTNPEFYVPYAFNLSKTSQMPEILEVGATFRQLYFNGAIPTQLLEKEWIQFRSDMVFTFGVDRTIRDTANHTSLPLYYYTFSYDGAMNMAKKLLGLNLRPGACHADVRIIILPH